MLHLIKYNDNYRGSKQNIKKSVLIEGQDVKQYRQLTQKQSWEWFKTSENQQDLVAKTMFKKLSKGKD